MRKLFRFVGFALGGAILLVLIVYAVAFFASERGRSRTYELAKLALPVDGSAEQVEKGRHLALTRGCNDCHGKDLAGAMVIDGGPVGQYIGPNITPGGRGKRYDAASFEHAIRHGVSVEGRSLLFMPSGDYNALSDADVAALIAYLQSVPAIEKEPAPSTIGPLARVLYLFGQFPLFPAEYIDHTQRAPAASPAAEVTVEYGRYIAHSCNGCHGEGLSGGHVPGTPPEFKDAANLTPDASGLKGWSEADFLRAMREGKRPDGRELDAFMPWKAFGQMNDVELKATWVYLQSVPPKATGHR